jgi:hypothetical protein
MIEKDALSEIFNQSWRHSHEEDTGSEMVFRPASYDFPPSRGRIGFRLTRDGSAIVDSIAPADGSREQNGSWSLDQNANLQIDLKDAGAWPNLTVVSVGPDRLIVQK